MSLVGGIAGLGAWGVVVSVTVMLQNQPAQWVSDVVAASVLGALIGGLTVAFSDRWSGNRVMGRWIASGTFIGLAAGFLAGCIQIPITTHLSAQAPFLGWLLAWMLAGSFIGLGLGLRWVSSNKNRVIYATAGGLLGGIIFAGLGNTVPDLSQAAGFVAVGVGICFGITLAPILLRDGLLQFVSSGDPRAQMKFGPAKKEWELNGGGSYLIGSENGLLSRTNYLAGIEVFIPDAAIAAQHAILFAKDSRFYVGQHPDTATPAGLARYIVRVRGKSVVHTQELRHCDDLLIGRTALRFLAKKAVPAA